MADTWFDELTRALEQPALEQDPSIWAELRTRLDINEYQPAPQPGIIVREILEKAEHYFVLKNPREKTYLRLSPDEYHLWLLMDGQRAVKDLVVEHFVRSGAFSRKMVTQLINQLIINQFLLEKPVYTWASLKKQVNQRTWGHKLAVPAQMLLTQQLQIAGIDLLITGLYKTIGWIFFTRPAQTIMAVIALVGFVLFNLIVTNPSYVFFSEMQPSELALLWLAALLPILIHELGHALTVKHYGREINTGGLMLYFGLPAAYIDTTDIWMEGRRARLNVTWNGPYTGFLVGGLCAISMWLYPANSLNPFLFKMASVAYLTILINVNPLLKYDGYYLLSDTLNISYLRERSLAFLQKNLPGKLAHREKLTRDEKIFTIFGIFSMVWTAYALYLAVAFWQTRLSSSLQVLLGSNYNLVNKSLEFLSAAAFVSLLALILLQLLRFVLSLVSRFVHTGGLQKHGRLALIGLAFAAIVSFGAAYSVQIYRGWPVIAVVSGLSFVSLAAFLVFNQAYATSNRWAAQIFLALALLSLSLVPISEELLPTGSAHSRYLMLGATAFTSLAGFLFIWPAIRQIKPLQIVVGLLIGGILIAAGFFLHLFTWTLAFVPLLGLVATLSWFNLRGSGRFPALALIYLGVASATIAFALTRYIPRYWSLGILISCAGTWHIILARLPKLSKYEPGISPNRQDAIGYSVMILVKRIIAQVYFESGRGGINAFGERFTAHAKTLGINLSINGNQFSDGELAHRATFDLTEVYGLAFDRLFEQMKARYGSRFSRQVISLGVDLIPWQYREVISELVLVRRQWGMEVSQEKKDQRARRIKLLDRVPLFVNATYDDLKPIAAMLTPRQYAANEVIIRQGDPGNEFFIIESGKCQVWQQEGDADPQQVQSLGVGQFFGEAALITNQPRNATVVADTPSVLLSLGRDDFETLIRHHIEFAQKLKLNLRHGWILRNMPIFDEMSAFDLNVVISQLKAEKFQAGQLVIRQGDEGDKFYIIETGELSAFLETNGTSVELERLTAGDYFGETALIYNQPRRASILALTDSMLYSLDRDAFVDLLENFQNMRQLVEKTSTRRIKNTNLSV